MISMLSGNDYDSFSAIILNWYYHVYFIRIFFVLVLLIKSDLKINNNIKKALNLNINTFWEWKGGPVWTGFKLVGYLQWRPVIISFQWTQLSMLKRKINNSNQRMVFDFVLYSHISTQRSVPGDFRHRGTLKKSLQNK